MRLIKPVSSLRSKSHLHTRLELHNEWVVATRMPWMAGLHVAFSVADWLETGKSLLYFASLRVCFVGVAWILWFLLRARVYYSFRFFALFLPYMLVVEYILLKHNLVLSPYFSGIALVMICGAMLMPLRTRVAGPLYFLSITPILFWAGWFGIGNPTTTALTILMTLGTVIICTFNAGQVHSDFCKRLEAQEALARDLGRRDREIREKADELLKRRTFESQFSPQVVSSVLVKGSASLEMQEKRVTVAVIDVIGSSQKTKELDPQSYKEVIEEVFDVFSSACLRWNITVDKFTGDGAQAFAGAPTASPDDTSRALLACRDTIQMLGVRKKALTRRWGEPLQIRSAVCEGTALVGFIGRGTLKSYTAIGETVSFTHRLCAAGQPGRIACYSLATHSALDFSEEGFDREFQTITKLKGFDNEEFEIAFLSPTAQAIPLDNGRCKQCGTPLVTEQDANGLPILSCPGCESRTDSFAA